MSSGAVLGNDRHELARAELCTGVSILNVTIDKGPLRSTLHLNLRMDGSDLEVEDIPNGKAEEAFKLVRQGIDEARRRFTV
jgi:hypothetical protein